MANPYIWGNLNRALNDETLIDEAIQEAVAAHNDDPDAHLEADQSLQSHRAAEIIDHLAESVVNDKIAPAARAYIAIVDPASDVDFDTINSAVTYAIGKGGGTILIMPGIHYISGDLECPTSINFQGIDQDSCIISANSSGGNFLHIIDDAATNQTFCTFQNLQFKTTGGYCLFVDANQTAYTGLIQFLNCNFLGGGNYLVTDAYLTRFTQCNFQMNATYALSAGGYIHFEHCNVDGTAAVSSQKFLTYSSEGGNPFSIITNDLRFRFNLNTHSACIDFQQCDETRLDGLDMPGLGAGVLGVNIYYIRNCILGLSASGYIQFAGSSAFFINNIVTGGTGNRLRIAAGNNRNIVMGNILPSAITNSGTNNVAANNVLS